LRMSWKQAPMQWFESFFIQWAKSPKHILKKCVFVNSSLKILCHVVKNALLQIACFFGDFAHWALSFIIYFLLMSSIRYFVSDDFKPASIDTSQPAEVMFGSNKECVVTYPNHVSTNHSRRSQREYKIFCGNWPVEKIREINFCESCKYLNLFQ